MTHKFLVCLVSLVIGSVAMLPASAAANVSSGAPGQFAPCLKGGYQTLSRSNGTSFANLGECVSYAVRGGTLFRGIDASSVYTEIRGVGGPAGPPDANGNLPGGTFDGGIIAGAFSAPSSCVPPFCGNFSMAFSYLVHPSTGMVDGTGTASCDPCVVAGLTGTISFTTTVVGHAVTNDGLFFGVYDSGTWQIATATGDLAGISGAGTWTPGTGTRVFAGKLLAPI